jgi:hypothetical protein
LAEVAEGNSLVESGSGGVDRDMNLENENDCAKECAKERGLSLGGCGSKIASGGKEE